MPRAWRRTVQGIHADRRSPRGVARERKSADGPDRLAWLVGPHHRSLMRLSLIRTLITPPHFVGSCMHTIFRSPPRPQTSNPHSRHPFVRVGWEACIKQRVDGGPHLNGAGALSSRQHASDWYTRECRLASAKTLLNACLCWSL